MSEDARPPTRRRKRELVALAVAFVVHAALFLVITRSSVRRVFPDRGAAQVRVEVEIAPPPLPKPPPVPPTEPPQKPPQKPPRKPPPPARGVERSGTDPAVPPSAGTDEPSASGSADEPTTTSPPSGESLMRLPTNDGMMGRVLGTGEALGPTIATLEGALDLKADGPLSDGERAARNARRALAQDLADDEVTVGLADDYFRELRNHVETSWRPEVKQLNDGGESVTQAGMMKSFVEERAAWDEMWKAYLDLAKMYGQGRRPRLEPARIERIRELMRSRKGMFRFHAISEVVLTQGPDGKVLTVEMPLSSGHPAIDDGMRDAIARAVDAMVDPPPARLHQGRTFSSTWRMRATWTMVPPTALLTGAGFDVTPKGIHVDVPFDIKLKTAVLLLRTDGVSKRAAEGAAEGDEGVDR